MGSFWDAESVFGRVKGVSSTGVVYVGAPWVRERYKTAYGTPYNGPSRPKYKAVCADNKTTLAEGVTVEYDPNLIDYSGLLDVFWSSHDPGRTTWTRENGEVSERPESQARGGGDPASREVLDRSSREASVWQFRSEIFPHDEVQWQEATLSVEAKVAASDSPILTTVSPLVDEIESGPERQHWWYAEAYLQKYLLQQNPDLFACTDVLWSHEWYDMPESKTDPRQFDQGLLDVLLGGSDRDGRIMAQLCGLAGSRITRGEADRVLQKLKGLAPKKVVQAASRFVSNNASFAVDEKLKADVSRDVMERLKNLQNSGSKRASKR